MNVNDFEFLFDSTLTSALENLIRTSKLKLILISPFIDLDKRFQDALSEKINSHDFELFVLFGKNEGNYYKSVKKDSFDFLKTFPNVEIRYNDRLHAKFYLNDFDYIITSLNLYDYSLGKNIEVGVKFGYVSKGLLWKIVDGSNQIVERGVAKVKQEVLGTKKEIDPIEKFQAIFASSELLYKTEPIIVDKSGIKGVFGAKKLNGFKVIIDNLRVTPTERLTQNSGKISKSSIKTLSASQLSKLLGISSSEITNFMSKVGLISKDTITDTGRAKGLTLKSYMGKDYIAYPENLIDLKELKN